MVDTARIELQPFQISPIYSKEDVILLQKRNKGEIKGILKLISLTPTDMEIDFIGFHTSIVNSFRRIILAEVPTMAIEKVSLYNNTSIVQDEVLAHRLGLIPLKADPRLFEFKSSDTKEWGPESSLKYELKIKCYKDQNVDKTSGEIDHLYKNRKALSCHIKWVPIGNQETTFRSEIPGPLHDDILIAKLNPGHEIILEATAVKGIGSDHAKFQPGIAWYRLLPEVEITKEVYGTDAKLLQKCFSPGVIDLVTDSRGRTVAKVNCARNDSCSRNVFQHDNLKDKVKLTRKTDHIIFYVESQSFLKSHEILVEAVSVMITKCDTLLTELNKYIENDPSEAMEQD
ncbi:UNVERIFIED_CONTAM: hypothetical protein RMT77_002168 [Armadillidium vulgare]